MGGVDADTGVRSGEDTHTRSRDKQTRSRTCVEILRCAAQNGRYHVLQVTPNAKHRSEAIENEQHQGVASQPSVEPCDTVKKKWYTSEVTRLGE